MTDAERATAPAAPPFGLVDVALIGLMAIWGANFVVVKAAVTQFLPLAFTALRFALAGLVLLAVLIFNRVSLRVSRADLGRLALLGLVGNIIYQPLFVLGIARTTAGNSALILAASPVAVAIENHLLGQERLHARAWAGVALSFGGLALVILGGPKEISLAPETLLGDALTLGAVLCWATYTVMSRPLVTRLNPLAVTSISLLIGAGALLLIATPSFLAQDWSAVRVSGWLGLLYSGVLAIGLGYAIWGKGVQRLGGARTSVYSNLNPIVAALTGALFLGEHIALLQVAGAACVFGGIVLARSRT
jgi:drug/metabolite transporter (DMT)-like permease